MAKFTNFLLLMSGLILLFYFMGLIDQTPNSTLLNMLLEPEGLQNSSLSLKALLAIEAILASAIVIGFAYAGNIELGVMVSFSIALFNILWDFISVFNVIASFNIVLAILVLSPLLLLFIVTMLEWWRGLET